MLEKLAEIRWDRLEHAYGIASDVPTLLLGLASKKPGKRRESLQNLYSTIWHQGTVYQATSSAVPFLCELLRNAGVDGKANILGLLQAIHSAYPRRDAQPDPVWREKLYPFEAEHLATSAKWARRARKAVSAEIGTYLSLLEDASPFVRGTAAFTLVCCGKRSADIQRRLGQAIDKETHAGVKAALIYAWFRLSRKSRAGVPFVVRKLRCLACSPQEKAVVRFISAMGLEPFFGERSHAKLVRFLAWTYRKSGKALAFLSRCHGSFDLLQEVSDRRNLRLELCFELARKPNQFFKKGLCFDLEHLCRERCSNFARVVPVLGQLLSDRDPEFRVRVAMTLSEMGTWTRFAQPLLVRALQDSNPQVALWSAVALSKLRDPHVLPFVIENLAPEQHTDVQESPITEATPVNELVRIQLAAAKHLQRLGLLLNALRPFGSNGREALPQLRELFVNRGTHIQKMVCLALAIIGEPARGAVPLVGKLLKNPETQGEAASALMRWGLTAAEAIPDLIELLQRCPDADSWAKNSAMAALGIMGKAAERALPILRKQLRDPDCVTKCAAALAIWRIVPRTQEIIEVLVSELREKTKPGWAIHGCVEVVRTLEAIGPSAKPARQILEKLLNDPDGWARVYAVRALWKIGTDLDLILPVLIDDLLCRPLGISTGLLAAECLAEIGSPAAAAIPRLKEILAREDSLADFGTGWVERDESYRRTAMHALAAISGDAS